MEPTIIAHTQQYIVGTMTPTPDPEILGPSPLVFRAPIAPAQNATVSEVSYGNRTTTPAQVYTLGNGCTGLAAGSLTSYSLPWVEDAKGHENTLSRGLWFDREAD